MNSIRIIICLCLLSGLWPLELAAQQKQYSEEVTVIGAYRPTITDANKIQSNPRVQDTVLAKPAFTYKIVSKPYPTVYLPEPIEAAKMAGEPISKLHENLLKLGLGTYLTPYADYFFNSTRSKTLAYGVNLKHLSSSGKIKGYGYPGYSNNELSLFVRNLREKKFNLHADGGFQRRVVHYYGYHTADFEPDPDKEDIRQRFGLVHLSGGIKSARKDSGELAYFARVKAYSLFDKYNSAETNVKAEGGIEKTQPLLQISKEQRWGIHGALDYFNDKSEHRASGSRAILSLKPFLFAQRDALILKAGFNTSIEADTTAYLHFYPDIELKAKVLPGWLTLNFGITGFLERNSYRAFTTENPFVDPEIPLSFKNTKFKVHGGFNSNFFNIFDVFLEISRSQVENQYFYVNNTFDSLQNKFTLLYDENCDIFELKSELAWRYSERFSLMFRFHLHQYFTSDALPWHISDYNLGLVLSYNIQNKLLFDASLLYFDRMYAITYNPSGYPESKYLRDRLDINLGIEYRYSRLIAAFIRLNNIGNIQYYYWNNYPSQKFNAMAGLAFSF